jgi:hypothetical protein
MCQPWVEGNTVRVYKADKIVDPAARINQLVDKWERVIKTRFLIMVSKVQETALEEIVTLLETGQINQAIQLVEVHVQRFAVQVNRGFVDAGESTALVLEDGLGVIDFDPTNTRAVQRMQENKLRLVREFTDEQRRATRQALTRGIEEGANPRVQARAFRDSIGLTQRQEAAVANYRRFLIENDSRALERNLRDHRYDRSVERAIREDRPLGRQQINRMVERYRQRYVRYRSEVIARTESLGVVHEGTDEMYRQAIDAGRIQPQKMKRFWIIAGDDRMRESHDSMQVSEVRGIEEPFISGKGNLLRFPGDPAAPSTETIQCRCAVTTVIEL